MRLVIFLLQPKMLANNANAGELLPFPFFEVVCAYGIILALKVFLLARNRLIGGVGLPETIKVQTYQ
jgi:hypothetical protein